MPLRAISIILLAAAGWLNAAPGDRDPSFGFGGDLVTHIARYDYCESVALQADGDGDLDLLEIYQDTGRNNPGETLPDDEGRAQRLSVNMRIMALLWQCLVTGGELRDLVSG